MNRNPLPVFLKGLVIGGTMLVPGVSGGSMAMILNIYEPLLSAVGRFPGAPRKHLGFLAVFALGACIGMLLLAAPLLGLISACPGPALYFFLGAILGAVPAVCRASDLRPFTWRHAAWILLGLTTAMLIGALPENLLRPQSGMLRPLLLAAAGFASAAALILPGISVSWFLLVLGLYEDLMRAVSMLDFAFLVPLALGLLIGVLTVARLLERALHRHPKAAWPVILGFVLGSAFETFPGLPTGLEWPLYIAAAAAGFFIVFQLGRPRRGETPPSA